jgi:hypothetical protein
MDKQRKEEIEIRKSQIMGLIKEFCNLKLDQEYLELSEQLLNKLGRKRDVPFIAGKIEIWAVAVIHALGTINFLFDKSFEPYVTVDEINGFFKTNKSSTGQKSKIIRDLLKLGYYDSEFSTNHMKQDNPFAKLTMVDGFIVPKVPVTETVTKKEPLPKIQIKKEIKINLDDSQLSLFSNE